MLTQCLIGGFGVSGEGFRANAVDFNGSTDYLSTATAFNSSNGTTGIFSCWVRLDGGNGSTLMLVDGSSSHVIIQRNSSNKFYIRLQDSGGSTLMELATSNSYTSGATWYNILASWNSSSSSTTPQSLYINGTSDKIFTSTATGTINYGAGGGHTLMASGGPSNLFNGCISEMYIAPNQYLDFSVQANREKFILGGKPVNLGSDGSLPTGSAPRIYLKNPAATVGNNSGTGGNLTVNGSPAVASTSPSD